MARIGPLPSRLALWRRGAPWLSRRAAPAIPLWPDGAPGSETRRQEPEIARDWWVRNVHRPSLTPVFPFVFRESRAAVVVVPGGGHAELVFGPEGLAPARYLARLGIAAFALKYRLAREAGSPYSVEQHAAADLRRALRLVRSRAREWRVDPGRVGVMGWSAGAELAALVAYRPADGVAGHPDPVERESARPSFQILVYPGPLGVPDEVPEKAPPAFFVGASDDEGPAETITSLLERYRRAGVSVEAHLYARGGHGFNMGDRSDLAGIRAWPATLADWLVDSGWARARSRSSAPA
jgi:acetyl esterase/lipase